MKFHLLFVCIACYVSPAIPQSDQIEANRIIQENSNGWCSILSYCPQVFNFLQTQRPRTAERYVQALQNPCGNRNIGAEPVICCAQPTTQLNENLLDIRTNNQQSAAAPTCGQVAAPKPTFVFAAKNRKIPRRLPTLEEGCGRTFIQSPRFTAVDTVNAKKGAWPWIAMIFYLTHNTTEFHCPGTLVTARHVISSISCYGSNHEEFVRLGANGKTIDAVGDHVDIPVERSIVNEAGYLQILFLEHNVEFSNAIVPICMPSSPELRKKSYANHFAFALGFGTYAYDCKKQKKTDILQEQQLSFVDCKEHYRLSDSFDNSYLCPREPACSRDYGSPLMIAEPYGEDESRYFLIGIFTNTQEGYHNGNESHYSDNFYSSTQTFMDWVEQALNTRVTASTN